MYTTISRSAKECWYELSLISPSEIVIKVSSKAYGHFSKILKPDVPIIQELQKRHGLTEFILPNKESWGFGPSLKRTNKTMAAWVSWQCQLPIVRYPGKTQTPTPKMEFKPAYELCSTLQVLTLALSLYNSSRQKIRAQLIGIESLATTNSLGGFGLMVSLSPSMAAWLHAQPDNSSNSMIVKAMQQAHAHMWQEPGTSKLFKRDFMAWCRQPKWINLQVPGNACDLAPERYGADEENIRGGYLLYPHNIDSPLQQLTFLAGIARMHDLARADGY